MRPVQMSKVRIFIEQDEIAALINFLPTLEYVAVKEIISPDEALPSSRTLILKETMQEYQKKIQMIIENLDFVDHTLGFSKSEKNTVIGKKNYNTKDIGQLIDLIHIEALEFRQNIENSQSEIRNLAINKESLNLNKAFLQVLDQFHMTSAVFTKLHHFRILTFSLLTANIEKVEKELFKSEITTFFYKQTLTSDRSFSLIICKAENEEQIRQILKVVNPEYTEIPRKYVTDIGIELPLVETDLTGIDERVSTLKKEYDEFRQNSLLKLLALQEVLENIQKILGIEKQFILVPPHTGIIEVWIPTKIVAKVIASLSAKFKQKIRLKVTQIRYSEIPYEEGYGKEGKITPSEEVPTLMSNNWFARPFGTLLRLYGLPRYTEIDPTMFLAITFPLLFGLMFADAGHGVVLIIVGIIGMLKYRKKSPGVRDISQIFMYCGFGAIFGGLLMGEWFGNRISEIPWLQWAEVFNIFQEPLANIGFLLKAVILVGVIHICLGWVLQAANYTMSKRKYLAFADSGIKIALLSGGTWLIFTYLFDINAWMAGPFPPIMVVLIPAILLVFMRAIGKLFRLRYLEEESVGSLIGEGSIETMETVLGILSNVASYSRLMALGLSHLGLMLVVKATGDMTAAQVSGFWGEVIITFSVVMGNFLVILIESLVAFIHNMRLHFYEFFSKFYKGSGVPFKQFQLANKHSELVFAI